MPDRVATLRWDDSTDAGPLVFLGFGPAGFVHEWPLAGTMTVGRMGSGADIQIPSGVVSSSHGTFDVADGCVYYLDEQSTNGTSFNGELVDPTAKLAPGDVLAFPLGRDARNVQFSLVLMRKPAEGWRWRTVEFGEDIQQVVFGRGTFDVSLGDAYVSERHASFFRSAKGPFVLDLQSTNGVRLNGQLVQDSAPIRTDDIVQLGQTLVQVHEAELLVCEPGSAQGRSPKPDPGQKARPPMPHSGDALVINIEKKNVWDRFKEKTLLRNIELAIEPGDLVLVLGGSGAGKSTFFNAVMGSNKADGSIHLGNIDVYEEYERVKYQIGHVPQKDLVRLNDTVYHTLLDAAMTKMPARTTRKEYEERVRWAIDLLGLGPQMNTMVSRISGGQLKRLSIAVDLVSDPELFFLDEPDSGLDGVMATELMQNLRAIADMGKIVLVITHGPDRGADLFSKVIVLAKSELDGAGHLAFFGTVDEAKVFFGVDKLEGIIRRINRTDEGGEGRADEYIKKWEDR